MTRIVKQIFPYGKPVTGPDLVNRKEVIAEITSNLSSGQSIIISSPRRYGKSSVMLECIKRLKKQGYFTGFVDLFEISSLREFAVKIVETTLSNQEAKASRIFRLLRQNLQKFLEIAEFKHVWKEHEFILGFAYPEADEMDLLDKALDFPQKFAASREKKMVMAFDEFGDLAVWNGKLLKKMRAKFQRHDSVTYFFSGSQETLITKLFTARAEAFYGFGKLVGLSPLPEDDVAAYLKRRLRQINKNILDEAIVRLCRISFCHPHYFKVIAQAVLHQIQPGKKSISKDDVDRGFQAALLEVKGELDGEWQKLLKAPLQRRVLKFLALSGKEPFSKSSFPDVDKSQIYFSLSELQKKGLIVREEKGKYVFINPFFKEYLKALENGDFI